MALALTPQDILDKGEYHLLAAAPRWQRVPIGQIASVQNGAAFKSKYFTHEGGLPLIRIRDVGKVETENHYNGPYEDEYLVSPGDILIGMDGDFRAARWAGDVGLLNQRVCRLKIKSSRIDQSFLFYCLQPFLNAINAETSSVTVKHLSSRTVADIPLPLPPLDEQRRIVAKIEELFSELGKGVESLTTARAQLKTYRQSLLKAAFEGRLTEQWRHDNADKLETADQLLQHIREEREDRYQQDLGKWKIAVLKWEEKGKSGKKPRKPAIPKEFGIPSGGDLAGLPELPQGWFWTWLGSAAEVAGGITKNQKRQQLPLKRPFLRVANVYANRLVLDEVHEIGLEETEANKVALEAGDLLIVEGNGSTDQIGRVAVWDGSVDDCVHQNHLIRARLTNSVLSRFALWFLLGKQGRDLIVRTASSTSGLHTLSISKVGNLLIPVCSVGEQIAVLEELEVKLSHFDQLKETIDTTLQQSESLRQSILKRAFEGKLVPQDANEEPASVLLERIRQEQADRAKETRCKRKAEASA